MPRHRLMSDDYQRIEIITGTERRRRWSAAEKLSIVEETLLPGESVSAVARRHGVAANLLHTRRQPGEQRHVGSVRENLEARLSSCQASP